MTKEQLEALIKEHIKAAMSDEENMGMMKGVLQGMLGDLQGKVHNPFTVNQAKGLITGLPFASLNGDYLSTKQGSLVNLKNVKSPFVAVSDELGAWAIDFAKYIKTGQVSKLMSEGVDANGGYLVPEEFRAVMIMFDAEPTVVWPRATIWPMTGEKLQLPKLQQNLDVDSVNFDAFAGVSYEWVEEGGTKPETQPSFGMIEMIVHELAGYTEITNSLLDDSAINLTNYLVRIFRAAWYWYTDKAFIQGTGGKQPLGIINDPGVLSVARATADTVTVDDVINMDAKLPAAFDAQAVWFYSKKARAKLRGQKVSDSSDELVLQEHYNDLAAGYPATILGRPAILADGKIPVLGETGDMILGAWSWYYIGQRQDFVMDSSTHFKFRNNRTAMRCSGRVDGQAAVAQAFVLLDAATS